MNERQPPNPPKRDFVETGKQSFILNIKYTILRLLFLVLVINVFIFPQTSIKYPSSSIKDIAKSINQIINDPFFERTTIALDIFDLTDSIALFQKNNKLILRPASNMKLLTSAAALLNLGEYYSFRTDLYHTGVIEAETLYGDVFVVGGFDPSFSLQDLDSLIAILESLGIKKITGGIYAK